MLIESFACIRCGARYRADIEIDSSGCGHCYATAPANLRPVYPVDVQTPEKCFGSEFSLWRYAAALPCLRSEAITLGEGLTPLILAERLGAAFGMQAIYIKDEGRNPTWSHKDRFSTVAVSYAQACGARVVATASSGNAGASLAAYAARAGMKCVVATFADTAGPMVSQMRRYGAEVIPFVKKQDRWEFLKQGVDRHGWFVTSPYHAPVVGSHPVGIEGYKTLAYEIVEQMGGMVPHWCILPVCYGDALAGLWHGFKDLADAGRIQRLPRLAAAEIYGSLSHAMATGTDLLAEQPMGTTSIAVSIGAPRSTFQALKALRESNGVAISVDNTSLLRMQETLASHEGLFAELASVAPLVVLDTLRKDGVIEENDLVVAVATASGLKDVDRATRDNLPLTVFSSVEAALSHLEANDHAPGRN
ncbi:threonine synthase [Oryzicola mucosus]|uniref:Threonine synthase n=1 Tax=Oryzicola mucosus TaxID=2767425 RepID=A0A8J6PLM2_9HYPH|nr:threonine synthase [Oryzicola mucosus]MBD0416824.1 threonine synthase [Oryzicola mucosus]